MNTDINKLINEISEIILIYIINDKEKSVNYNINDKYG